MKKFLIIIIFTTGCSFNNNEEYNNLSNLNFSDSLSFKEFEIKLKDYGENSPYPNIDE